MTRLLIQLDHATGGGGGGGGASFIFMINKNGTELIPVLVAAGGGGLGEGKSANDGRQHGHGVNPDRKPVTGSEYGLNASGAGGGWKSGNNVKPRHVTGIALVEGGFGGSACNTRKLDEGQGGFGGGGSGCKGGGGGGGYAGGNSYSNESVGEGGYSYLGEGLFGEVQEGAHDGMGAVYIIPAITGCRCNYRCLALDEYRHSVQCICPEDWVLGDDNVSCNSNDKVILKGLPAWLVGSAIVVVIVLSVFGTLLWKRKCVDKESGSSKKLCVHLRVKDRDVCAGS